MTKSRCVSVRKRCSQASASVCKRLQAFASVTFPWQSKWSGKAELSSLFGLRVTKVSTVTRIQGGRGRETQLCRHFWTCRLSARLKSANSHRDPGWSWSRNKERNEEKREKRGERGQRREEMRGERREERRERRGERMTADLSFLIGVSQGVIILAMYMSRVCIRVCGSYQVHFFSSCLLVPSARHSCSHCCLCRLYAKRVVGPTLGRFSFMRQEAELKKLESLMQAHPRLSLARLRCRASSNHPMSRLRSVKWTRLTTEFSSSTGPRKTGANWPEHAP